MSNCQNQPQEGLDCIVIDECGTNAMHLKFTGKVVHSDGRISFISNLKWMGDQEVKTKDGMLLQDVFVPTPFRIGATVEFTGLSRDRKRVGKFRTESASVIDNPFKNAAVKVWSFLKDKVLGPLFIIVWVFVLFAFLFSTKILILDMPIRIMFSALFFLLPVVMWIHCDWDNYGEKYYALKNFWSWKFLLAMVTVTVILYFAWQPPFIRPSRYLCVGYELSPLWGFIVLGVCYEIIGITKAILSPIRFFKSLF